MKATIPLSVLLLSFAASAQPDPGFPTYQEPYRGPVPIERLDLNAPVSAQDLQFITDATEASLTEAAIGRLARLHGQNAAVKQLGQRLVDDHQLAIRQLALVAARLGVTLPTRPDEANQRRLMMMTSFYGREFDDAFLRHVIVRDEAVTRMFRKEVKDGQSADLRDFAEATIPMLERHVRIAIGLRDDGRAFSSL